MSETTKRSGAMSYKEFLTMDTLELILYLESLRRVPEFPEINAENAGEAARELRRLSGYYSFLTSISGYARALKRKLKTDPEKKEIYGEMIDKEAIIAEAMKATDLAYRALNKSLTIYSDSIRELRMTGSLI